MRRLNQRSAVSVDDDALLRRRRTIETAALVARTFGMISTGLAAAGAGVASAAVATDDVRIACWAGVGVMAVNNVLSYLGRRRPASHLYPRFSAMQTVLDTATIAGIVVLVSRQSDLATWPLLAPAIAVAATRHQLAGALMVFTATSLAFALLVPGSAELFFMVVAGFMIAVITGTQASALNRHLTALNDTRRALQHQATHDALTGLPNRGRLAAYADDRSGRPLAVLLLDLNGFKQVNDTYGHAAGDRLLHEIGGRLTVAAGPGAVAGRLGGDEFLILLPGAGTAEVTATCERVREAVCRPVGLGDGAEVTVGVSVGVALRPAGGEATLDRLAAEADAAMYREKHDRKAA
jgi:diguanylate cyclase (GGDEF)-like protein